MKFKKFQVRQFGGRYPEFFYKDDCVYSVIMHVDSPKGTVVYESTEYINMPYEEALAKAHYFEKNYETDSSILDMSKWEQLDII